MSNKNEYKFLPLTMSLGTLGGIATPLIKRGTPLPAKRKQRFSTASENQKAITVLIFLGESKIASKILPWEALTLLVFLKHREGKQRSRFSLRSIRPAS